MRSFDSNRRTTGSLTVLLASVTGWAACSAPPPAPPPLQVLRVVELGRWQAFDGESPLGHLIQLEIRDPSGPVRFYQIEDAAGRIVGTATAAGRFSRRVPFQEEEQDLGVWALPRGVALLFDLGRTVDLRLVAVEADARRR